MKNKTPSVPSKETWLVTANKIVSLTSGLKRNTSKHRLRLLACGILLFIGACATSTPVQYAEEDKPKVSDVKFDSRTPFRAEQGEAHDPNAEALEHLWQIRTAQTSEDTFSPEFVLGPGDVLQISIPQIPQLANRLERVSEQSTISLPMLGEINVSGMTQGDLLRTLSQRTSKFVYHPQVDVFIQHTESRQVAVIGAVKTPGRYTLASKSDTIMTMIGRAGGMSDTAGSRIILLPGLGSSESKFAAPGPHSARSGFGNSAEWNQALAKPTEVGHPTEVPRSLDGATNSEVTFSHTLRQRIVISTTSAADQRYLDLRAKPGDVILIPAGGQVTVQGWVDKPGAFPITPGMTVLSSIAAAGGAIFSDSATLLREQDDGRKIDQSLDLAKLKNGEQRDLQVQGGDVIVVERSVAGALPYSLYFLVQRVGIGLPLIPAF